MSVFIVLLLIGFIILFHELGHFLAARQAGIPISVFSIGFGPRILSKMHRGTEYRLSLIPLGGYVMPAIEDEEDFFRFSVSKRFWMTLGGPLASILLALICAAIVNCINRGTSLENAFVLPFLQIGSLFIQMLAAIPELFTHSEQFSGIIGIVGQGSRFIGSDISTGFQFTAIMSLNLAVLNLLPIPALDGGKMILYLLEAIHPSLRRVHMPLAIAGWVFIMGLTVWVTAADIGRLISGSPY